MPDLELLVDSQEAGLTTVGEIYRSPIAARTPPVVTDVIARASRSARFALSPGDYAYHFHVELGAGVFTITIRQAGVATPIASDEFDTAFGFNGRVLRFSVAP